MSAPVWITGAQGFLGGHLARFCADKNLPVIGFGRRAEGPHECLDALYPHSTEGFAQALSAHPVPIRVFHLAGGATVGQSLANPHGDFESNVVTTETLLEALRNASLQVPVVFASSAAVYGGDHSDAISTGNATEPSSPYGFHKIMAEQLLRSDAQNFGLSVTLLRLFSIYGPQLRKQLLFDLCSGLNAASEGKPLMLGGTGAERRDWLHVHDTARAMAEISDPAPGDVQLYNLASGRGTEIRIIADAMADAWDGGRSVSFSGRSRAGDPFSLVADPASLPPGFVPRVELGNGLSQFVAWFREAHDKPEQGY